MLGLGMASFVPGAKINEKKRYVASASPSSSRTLAFALIALACGHALSSCLRTLPAIGLDLMATDLATAPQTLASLLAVYHFSFAALQIPVGAALDRFGVRPVALTLFLGTIVGALAAGLATGPVSFVFAQFLLGVSTSGMLMCPMTLAAKQVSPERFGLWSGAILSLGNTGMLLSSSPLAYVTEHYGWRAGFLISAAIGAVIGAAVFSLVPNQPAEEKDRSSPLSQMAEVLRLGLSRPMRGIIALALVSLASALVLRGVWGGPWLMDVKGLTRIQAANQLGIFTLSLIIAPLCAGIIDRKLGHRRIILAGGHLLAAISVALMALGAPGSVLPHLFHVQVMPPQFDLVMLVTMGFATSTQSLLFGMTTQQMGAEMAGRALAATNLALFLGTALLQSATGVVAAQYGLPAMLMFVAAALAVGAVTFFVYTQPAPR
jgi:predicted MFS family arabinose efflux permease